MPVDYSNQHTTQRTKRNRDAVVVSALRTPTARVNGAYAHLGAHELLAPVLTAVAKNGGIDFAEVSDVIIGNATGGGGNVARLAALTAGFPVHVPGVTVDRQCGSGLEAINLACRLVQSGAGEAYLAGGVESISTAPARAHRGPNGELTFYGRAQFAPTDMNDPDVGEAAEIVADRYNISRARQDEFAWLSHQRALAAQANGFLAAELVPLSGLQSDTGPRASLTPALLARFPAAFVPGGSVTAGNSCPDADGAAVVLVLTRSKALDLGFTEGLVMVDSAIAGCLPDELGVGAAASTRALRQRLGVDAEQPLAEQFPLIEFNEAFASQVLAVADQLALAPEDFNNDGGSLALGHPYGASGAVLVTRLLARARRANREVSALAMISMAGGMGISTAFNWQKLA